MSDASAMTASRRTSQGSLLVVGTGITGVGQLTLEALAAIEQADQLYYIVNDPITEAWLRQHNRSAQTLSDLYAQGKNRHATYVEMAARVIVAVRKGLCVCVAAYGHPGVFVQFSHAAIRVLRREGYPARMLPGVSADGCLIADVGLDPGDHGLQSFEATDFLLFKRRFDPTSALLLWQVGVLGEFDVSVSRQRQPKRLRVLARTLRRYYPDNHRVVVYFSNTFPGDSPSIERLTLRGLESARLSPSSTLFIPPIRQRARDARVHGWFKQRVE
jgi:uncharacterized protein YabN with tetrapyrrole methylase and pyrophosphatase domain